MARLHLSHVSKLFADSHAVNDVSVDVADGEFLTPAACLCNNTGKFVTENNRDIHRPALRIRTLVDIRTAHCDSFDLQHDLPMAASRIRDVSPFYATFG